MTRRQLRTHVFNVVYFCEFHNHEEFDAQVSTYIDDQNIKADDATQVKDKARSIIEHLEELDTDINNTAIGWKTSRMSKVDLSILRVALYEIKYDDDVPDSVAINEAVELAKSYSGDDSPGFINGILGKLVDKGKA